jgi:hypothetical protein
MDEIVWPTRDEAKLMGVVPLAAWYWSIVTHSWTDKERDALRAAAKAALL